jgi:hypothetical protein
LSEPHEPALRHAVDDLPARTVARQAERAGWVRAAKPPLSAKRLPATLSVAPGLAHRRNARLLGYVALGFLGLFAVSVLATGGLEEPVIVVLSLVPPATAGAGAIWHLMKARAAPSRFRLTLSETGVGVEADGRAWTAPLTAFEGVALRMVITQTANPRARQRRTLAEAKQRIGEEIRLYWVELTHPDPDQSIPLWASDAPFASSDGLAAARGFAARLGLPLLSTAGISSVWDTEPPPANRAGRRRR